MIRHWIIIAAVGMGGAGAGGQATAPPPSRPLLEQLDRESQGLYDQVRRQVVRVEMPVPTALMEMLMRENPVLKWGQQLDEGVRQQLENQQSQALSGQNPSITAEVATGDPPATAPAAAHPMASTAPAAGNRRTAPTTQVWKLVGIPMGQQDAAGRQGLALVLRPADARPAATQFTVQARAKVNTAGIILDDDGHVVVPLFLDKEAAGKGPIILYGAGGASCAGRFVASDSKMNLTILRMERMIGQPAVVDEQRPALGSVVMIVTPNQSAARLAVWTGGFQEFGIVCGLNGKIDGFVRYGQFLNAPLWRPVVQQLIEHGVVRRATLGVFVTQVEAEDPVRQTVAALQDRAAIQVHQVTPGSPAEQGGVRPGDFILSLDGQPVEDTPSFASAIAQKSGEMDLEILRDGQVVKASVSLVPK